jgi:hypothetical protein
MMEYTLIASDKDATLVRSTSPSVTGQICRLWSRLEYLVGDDNRLYRYVAGRWVPVMGLNITDPPLKAGHK